MATHNYDGEKLRDELGDDSDYGKEEYKYKHKHKYKAKHRSEEEDYVYDDNGDWGGEEQDDDSDWGRE